MHEDRKNEGELNPPVKGSADWQAVRRRQRHGFSKDGNGLNQIMMDEPKKSTLLVGRVLLYTNFLGKQVKTLDL